MKANNIPNKEKSKEEILAERQAKKLAKQNAKKKDKTEISRNANKDSDPNKNVTKIDSIKNETVVNITNKSGDTQIKSVVKSDNIDKAQNSNNKKPQDPCDTVDNSKEGRGADVVDGEIRIRMTPNVLSNFNEGVTSGKSRIQVSLEREAKKLDKLAKKQDKDTLAVTVKENIPVEPSTNVITEALMEKSKAELKAERRAKQEAQRAAKEAQKKAAAAPPPPVVEKKIVKKSPEVKRDVKSEEKVSEFKVHQHKLFSHLCIEQQPLDRTTVVHPAIVELGKKYSTRVISGSNARCVSLLLTLKQVITDYKVSTTSDLNRGLEAELAAIGSYLSRARPLSVSMTNSLRYLRSHLTQTSDLPDEEAKKKLLESIDTFIREQVDVAGQAISNTVQQKISNGDVILTYGCSSLVWRCLKESYQAGKEFSVVVVDGGPWYEGRELLRRLAALSIPCTYLLISAVGFAITKISKVLLGAHALLANGYVMSRIGSAMIALTASAHSVPVLVCCETYKFCERVQADSFVYNELGGGDEAHPKGVKWLSPIYDITPPDLVTAVVTELAILPCTSVPVVLRVKPSDIHHAT